MASFKIPRGNDPLPYAQAALAAAGLRVVEVRDIAHGWQLKGRSGGSVNVYQTGSVVLQGSNTDKLRAAFDAYAKVAPPVAAPEPVKPAPKAQRPAATAPISDSPEPEPKRPVDWDGKYYDGEDPPW